nr:SGNH/GDSL hydrolase family protein [Streptomyces sp. SID5468]
MLAAFVSAAAALAFGLGAAPAASAAGQNYVALGDSYSAGVGSTSDYLDSCDRSTAAYPYLYSQSHALDSFSFQACTGATAPDIENNQLGALNSATTLVSLTDGGNDVGFSTVMTDCVLYSDSTCLNAINSAEDKARNQLPGILDTLYGDIRSAAPGAHVVVVGYPEFYDLANSSGCVGLDNTKRTALDDAADVLDGVISDAVSRQSGFTFTDVRGGFSGHELCDSSAWLHSLSWPVSDSYHPTASGQSGAYLPAFEAGV